MGLPETGSSRRDRRRRVSVLHESGELSSGALPSTELGKQETAEGDGERGPPS